MTAKEQQTLYIGLMCGTSLDAIDAALVQFTGEQTRLIAHTVQPLDPSLVQSLSDISSKSESSIEQLMTNSLMLSEQFAQAVFKLLAQTEFSADDITAIGNHGVTVRHRPDSEFPFSMQIGEPNKLAQLTGIDVVSDFRNMDVAFGGQGAPLVPPFHQQLFAKYSPCAVLNLGGIANITILSDEAPIGYDTGPANTLMNHWCFRHTGKSYDSDGAWAASGKVHAALLNQLLAEEYFVKTAPKSTGKELFNLEWLDNHLHSLGADISAVDVQTTLCHLTAKTVADQISLFKVNSVFVCGGGVHNSFLISCLENYLPYVNVLAAEQAGINSDQIEAMAFAWLAKQRIENSPTKLMSVTNATQNGVLGAWYSATRGEHE